MFLGKGSEFYLFKVLGFFTLPLVFLFIVSFLSIVHDTTYRVLRIRGYLHQVQAFSAAAARASFMGTRPSCLPSTEMSLTVEACICSLTLTRGFLEMATSCIQINK